MSDTSSENSFQDQPLRKERTLRPISKEKHDTLLSLANGTFKVPVKTRSTEQKSAIVHYWRNKDHWTTNSGKLFHKGKEVLVTSRLKGVVEKEFVQSQGCGARSLHHKLKNRYAGASEREIRKQLVRSKEYQKLYAKFSNKATLIPINSKQVTERWQVDLIDMRSQNVVHDGKEFNYILSVLDVFSRFLFLRPLGKKSSSCCANELSKIIAEHGSPRYLQCDRGTEFRGHVESLLKREGINIIRSSAYHPQSQGKCERSHVSVRRKVRYMSSRKEGFNWAKDLHTVQHAINTCPKEVLGYRTPFQVYYNRFQDKENRNIARTSQKRREATRKVMKEVRKATKRCKERMLKSFAKKFPSSVYSCGETVLIRYPTGASRVPKKRFILQGKVLKRKPEQGLYYIEFRNPSKEKMVQWVKVDDITSVTVALERSRKKSSTNETRSTALQKRLHRKKYFITLDHEERLRNLDIFADDSISVLLDPSEYPGSCQFEAVANQMAMFGIHRSTDALRQEAVAHLTAHSDYYRPYVEGSMDMYLNAMQKRSTYGDHLTLQALARDYNLQFLVVSTNGPEHTTLVSNSGAYSNHIPLLTLGYFPENQGSHYVSIAVTGTTLQELINYFVDEEPTSMSPLSTSEQPALPLDPSLQPPLSPHELSAVPSPSTSLPLTDPPSSPLDPSLQAPLSPYELSAVPSPSTSLSLTDPPSSPLDRSLQAPLSPYELSAVPSPSTSLSLTDPPSSPLDPSLQPPLSPHELSAVPSPSTSMSLTDPPKSCSEPPQSPQPCISSSEPSSPQLPYKKPSQTSTVPSLEPPLQSQQPSTQMQDTADHLEIILPPEIIHTVISLTLTDDPSMRRTLRQVSRTFLAFVDTVPFPRIYIAPGSLNSMPRPVSVRRIVCASGRNSGVAIELRRILNNRRWFSAWLWLEDVGFGWYNISNICWRH